MKMVIMAPLHVAEEEKEHVLSMSKKSGISMNAVIRDLIQKDMKRKKSK